MRPLKLVIPGEFWDSQIYRGKLYLFVRDGSILTLDWDAIFNDPRFEHRLRLPLACAFTRSDLLYRAVATGILQDLEIHASLSQRFKLLEEEPIELTENDIDRLSAAQQENPFPFPHSDSLIYKRRIYISSSTGVHSANCDGRTKYPISSKAQKLVDVPTATVRASYATLALACGGEGLWEYKLSDEAQWNSSERFHCLHSAMCVDCHWLYYSIYASSFDGGGFLASYRKINDESHRELFGFLSEDEVFGASASHPPRYSWGCQDKICQSTNGTIRVAKYQPWLRQQILPLGELTLKQHEDLVSADLGLFGTILELPNRLLVLSSAGEHFEIKGEPVNWRVFPRSRHYENHLHVVFEDHISIFSFNHDYLVDQSRKVSGISARRARDEKGRSSFRSSAT